MNASFSEARSVTAAFAVGTGRCGTHLLAELMTGVGGVESHHIRAPIADSFNRYCVWNGLPVDTCPLISQRQAWIRDSSERGMIYFEANPYLGFHCRELCKDLSALLLFLVRNPVDVICSHLAKGWYAEDLQRSSASLLLGYQYGMQANHFFGRIAPNGESYDVWKDLTRVGKLGWMWNEVNLRILEDLAELDRSAVMCIKLEDFDWAVFNQVLEFLGIKNDMARSSFKQVCSSRPGKSRDPKPDPKTWSSREWREYEAQTAEARERLGYPLR